MCVGRPLTRLDCGGAETRLYLKVTRGDLLMDTTMAVFSTRRQGPRRRQS
jgi:hypothetical protein